MSTLVLTYFIGGVVVFVSIGWIIYDTYQFYSFEQDLYRLGGPVDPGPSWNMYAVLRKLDLL
jgi:hypothetical protein